MSEKPLYLNPYAISAALLGAMFYVALVIHVFLLAPDVIGHDEKGFALMILVVLPGKYLVDHLLKSTDLRQGVKDRIILMLFMGCVIGWTNIETTTGVWDTSVVFVGAFVLAAIGVCLLDMGLDWIKARWNARKSNTQS